MKLYMAFIMCLVSVQGNICVLGQFVTDEQIVKRGEMLDQLYPLLGMINNESVVFEQIVPKIKLLESLTKDYPVWYLESMEEITGQLQNRSTDEKATQAANEIIANAVFLSLEKETLNLKERTNAFYYQLRMILLPGFSPHKTDDIIDCDPELRQKNADRLLELYQIILSQIEENYDPDADENIPSFKGFYPPASYQGPSAGGMDCSRVEDTATREAYEQYLEEQQVKLHKYDAHRTVKEVREHRTEDVVKYLIDAYSLFPYRTAELEQVLTDRKFDSVLSKTILKAVRKTEQEIPDEGFRIWMSKDRLYKITAKFVSLEENGVTLEKSDGVATAIGVFALREFDQEYIRRSLEIEAFESEKIPSLPTDFSQWESITVLIEPPVGVHELQEGEVLNPDGSISNETITTVRISKEALRMPDKPSPSPPLYSNRLKIWLTIYAVFITIVFAFYFYFRFRWQRRQSAS